MAAKIASRKGRKAEQDFTPWVVVDAETGRRVYVGEGAPQDEAERIAAQLVRPARAVPLADLDAHGNLIVPDEEAAEPEQAEAVAA